MMSVLHLDQWALEICEFYLLDGNPCKKILISVFLFSGFRLRFSHIALLCRQRGFKRSNWRRLKLCRI